MAESESRPAEKVGASPKAASLPDLYRLLGLQPMESDSGEIEAALRRLLPQAKSSDSATARRAARLLKLGKTHLLNAEKKQAYDVRWQAVFGSRQAASSDANWAAFEALLPSGDPNEPFNLEDYLAHHSSSPEVDIEHEFQTLMSLIQPGSVDHAATGDKDDFRSREDAAGDDPVAVTSDRPASDHPAAAGSVPMPAAAMTTENNMVVAKPVQANSSFAPITTDKLRFTPRRLRKRRSQKFVRAVLGLLLCLAGIMVVVLAIVKLQSPAAQSTIANSAGGNLPTNDGPVVGLAPSAAEPQSVGSGLPEVSGLDDASRKALSDLSDPSSNSPDQSTPTIGTSAVANMAASGESTIEVIQPNRGLAGGENSPQADSNDMAVGQPNPPSNGGEESELRGDMSAAAEPKMTVEELAAWSATMKNWRKLLAAGQFAEAHEYQLEVQAQLGTSRQKQQQFQRLATVAKLAEQFDSAVREAVAELGAGSAFTVTGPTLVGFVEGNAEQLVLRINGRNRTFEMSQLPLGIAFGLADLKLDRLHPTSLAQKAAYGWLHAQPDNRVALDESQKWMASAESDNAVPAGTTQIFQHAY